MKIRVLFLFVFLSLACGAGFAQKSMRVKFAKNATTAIVTARLNNYKDKVVFLLRVKKGQALSVEQIKGTNSSSYVSLAVVNPDGEDVTDMDASCHSRAEVENTIAGDYRIDAYECQKADAWRGKFKLKIRVQ